jgi:hypothetical protein
MISVSFNTEAMSTLVSVFDGHQGFACCLDGDPNILCYIVAVKLNLCMVKKP